MKRGAPYCEERCTLPVCLRFAKELGVGIQKGKRLGQIVGPFLCIQQDDGADELCGSERCRCCRVFKIARKDGLDRARQPVLKINGRLSLLHAGVPPIRQLATGLRELLHDRSFT